MSPGKDFMNNILKVGYRSDGNLRAALGYPMATRLINSSLKSRNGSENFMDPSVLYSVGLGLRFTALIS